MDFKADITYFQVNNPYFASKEFICHGIHLTKDKEYTLFIDYRDKNSVLNNRKVKWLKVYTLPECLVLRVKGYVVPFVFNSVRHKCRISDKREF